MTKTKPETKTKSLALPISRAEAHARAVLDQLGGVDQLVALPASIIAGLLTDIDTWRWFARRGERMN